MFVGSYWYGCKEQVQGYAFEQQINILCVYVTYIFSVARFFGTQIHTEIRKNVQSLGSDDPFTTDS